MISTLTGIASGAIFSSVSFIESNYPWWASLLIALLPPLVGCLCDILVKKGIISKKRGEEIEKVVKEETTKVTTKEEKEKSD